MVEHNINKVIIIDEQEEAVGEYLSIADNLEDAARIFVNGDVFRLKQLITAFEEFDHGEAPIRVLIVMDNGTKLVDSTYEPNMVRFLYKIVPAIR